MNIWYDYRSAWGKQPWLAGLALLAVAMVVLGLVGTIAQSPLLFLFIPGLIALYGHHLLARRLG